VLKYATDFIIFGLIGMGLLKIVRFFQSVFGGGSPPKQLVYTDASQIDSLFPNNFSLSGLTSLQSSIPNVQNSSTQEALSLNGSG